MSSLENDIKTLHILFRKSLTLLSHCKNLLMRLPQWSVGVSKMLDEMTKFEIEVTETLNRMGAKE